MNIIAAILAGLAVATIVAATPTTNIDLQTAPTTGLSVAAQHAAVQTGIDEAGR